MGAIIRVVVHELGQHGPELALVDNDNVIKAFGADRSNKSFGD